MDHGCGSGRYVRKAASLEGETGRVYAVDRDSPAIKFVNSPTKRNRLSNVEAIKVSGYNCPLLDDTADLIYALDVFHMVGEPTIFLGELRRL